VRHRLPADVLLLATVLFWSLNFTAVKYALEHGFKPLAYSSVRFGVAAAIFSAFTYSREGSLVVRRRDVWLLLGAAGLGIWLNQVGFVYAVDLTSSVATVALLFGTLPIFVALFAFLFGVERLHLRHWIATVVSFGGVALVAAGSSGELGGDLGGILLGLFAAATWAGYSVAIGPLMRRYSPYRISAVVLLAGCVPLLSSAASQLARQDWGGINSIAWAACFYSLFFSLVVTNILWFTAIERVGAARSALYANLQPFLGAVFALAILSESLDTLQVVGGLVIGAGILVARRREAPVGNVD
jgi:drug/metabolite transporter (DMT)-like permease